MTTPSFDTWTSLFLFAVAMGLFLFTVLITSGQKKNHPIAFLLLAFAVILFQYVLFWTRYERIYPYFIFLPPVCYFASGPLLYRYFLNLYQAKITTNYWMHFIPALIAVVPTLVLWLRLTGWTDTEIPLRWFVGAYWGIAAHMGVYCFLIAKKIRVHTSPETEYKKVRHRWALVLLSLYGLFLLSYVSYYVLVNFQFFNSEWDYMISAMMTLSIYTIGYFIIKEPRIFDGALFAELFLLIRNKDESFENSLLNEFFDHLTAYMKREKPYLDNELRLVHLADQVGFSTHLLSKVINKKAGKSFNHFVNEYRLEEAERLLQKDSNQYVKSIYFDVGFNNKATFYKAFKKKHQCTPSQYKDQNAS